MGLPAAGRLGVTGPKDLRRGLFTLICLSVGRLWSPLAGVWTARSGESPCCAELHLDGVTGSGEIRRGGPEGPPSGVIYFKLLVWWSIVAAPGGGLEGSSGRISLPCWSPSLMEIPAVGGLCRGGPEGSPSGAFCLEIFRLIASQLERKGAP